MRGALFLYGLHSHREAASNWMLVSHVTLAAILGQAVYLRPWFPGLASILLVDRVGTGHPSVTGTVLSVRERFQMSRKNAGMRHPTWKPLHLDTDWPGRSLPLKTNAVGTSKTLRCYIL